MLITYVNAQTSTRLNAVEGGVVVSLHTSLNSSEVHFWWQG